MRGHLLVPGGIPHLKPPLLTPRAGSPKKLVMLNFFAHFMHSQKFWNLCYIIKKYDFIKNYDLTVNYDFIKICDLINNYGVIKIYVFTNNYDYIKILNLMK